MAKKTMMMKSVLMPLTEAERAEFLEELCEAETEEGINDQPQVSVCESGADMDFEWESTPNAEKWVVTRLGVINGILGHYHSGLSLQLEEEGLRIVMVSDG
jgi:hypothetical protein